MFLSSGRAAARLRGLRAKLCSPQFVLILTLLFLASPISLRAQMGTDSTGTGGRHVIQGRLYFPSGRRSDARIRVKLQSSNTGDLVVMADINGNFAFRGLAPGSYTVVIDGGDEFETARESVYIDTEVNTRSGIAPPPISRPYTVLIYLQAKRETGAQDKPGVLNAALANIPAQARSLYMQALEFIKLGDTKKAIEQLRAAVSLYPEFALALNELGVQYLRLNEIPKAAEALSQAVKLSPDAFPPRLNYGIVLLEKKSFAEAAEHLRQAVRKNEASALARYYLGLTLLNLRSYDEAESELQKSIELGGDQLSLAHKYLGGLYWRKKNYKRAAGELEAYLKLSPKAADAEQIRSTIKELRSKN
jgi:tetratricopeptide (TPR) repeat protein